MNTTNLQALHCSKKQHLKEMYIWHNSLQQRSFYWCTNIMIAMVPIYRTQVVLAFIFLLKDF